MMGRLKAIKKIIKNNRAFSMAETLVAVFILLMVSSVVAAGMPAAKDAYEKVVKASNAEVLMSTTIATLRNELGTAKNVSTSGKTITYYNGATGAFSKIGIGNHKYSTGKEVNTILYQRYAPAEGMSEEQGDIVPLSSEAVSTSDLYVTYSGVTYDSSTGIAEFTDLVVNDANTNTVKTLAGPRTVSIRVISY